MIWFFFDKILNKEFFCKVEGERFIFFNSKFGEGCWVEDVLLEGGVWFEELFLS